MWALVTRYDFSLVHTIILHMYRTVRKKKGQLPYAGLIQMILNHHKIPPIKELTQERSKILTAGESMILKMGFKQVDGEWYNRNKEKVLVELESE